MSSAVANGYQPLSSNMEGDKKAMMERMNDGALDFPSNEAILRHKLPWASMHKARLISDSEFNLIDRYDKFDLEMRRRAICGEDGFKYAELLLALLVKLSKADVLRYLLTLIDEIVSDDRAHRRVFLALSDSKESFPMRPLLRVLTAVRLNAKDPPRFIFMKALRIMALLMLEMRTVRQEHVDDIMTFVVQNLRKQPDADVIVGISALQLLLRREEMRVAFAQEDGLKLLVGVIRNRGNRLQLLYQTIMCLWLLGYSDEVRPQFPQEVGLIRTIVETLRMEDALKVRRICLAALRNLLGETVAEEQMVDAGMIRLLAFLNERKWADVDLKEDLEVLTERLESVVDKMSSFERYKAEVMSGRLYWSPVHTSETFWKESGNRLEDEDGAVLVRLLEIIRTSSDPLLLSVACHDVGEYVRHCSRGKMVVNRYGGKNDVMRLLQSSDDDVRKYALMALQKLMVQNWDALRNI